MKIVFDAYTRRARITPALLVVLPIAFAALAWFPEGTGLWGVLSSLVVASGGTVLVAEVGRDMGKRKEPRLYELWGGKPSVRLLRHRDAPNKDLLERRHKKLQQLVPRARIPTAQEEAADPGHADEVYESLGTFLREKTRDRTKFPLIFEELCNYGFRRNLWGMKPLGVAASVVGVGAVAALIAYSVQSSALIPPLTYACGVGCVLFLAGWIVWFTPNWVKIAADAYAGMLLAACDRL